MSQTPFTKDPALYTRDINVLKTYINDAALYISKQTGDDIETSKAWVKKSIMGEGAKFPIADPATLVLERGENGDRVHSHSTFSKYLQNTVEENDLMSPSMTTYLHPEKKKSLLGTFISHNMKLRSKDKKEGQLAEMRGDKDLAGFKNVMQTSRKIKNNSLSGAHSSAHNPLYNASSHPSLTSTCRCATSYANANNERFLAGNRHYWRHDIVINNIISIIGNSDYPLIEKVMAEFNLHYPTPDEVIAAIQRCTKPYWHHPKYWAEICELIHKLTPLERATFLYTQDMYNLAQFNRTVVMDMVTSLARKDNGTVEDPDTWVGMMDDDMKMMVCLICSDYLDGNTLSDQKKNAYDKYVKVAATAKNIIQTLDRFRSLIQAFWVTDHIPASIARFPSSIRHTVIASDTDSTLFTVQDWVRWALGELRFDDEANAIAAVMVYLGAQTLVHVLAKYSGMMGVRESQIHQLAMKNEFMMENMIITGKMKHYASRITAKEGNVYAKPKLDVKGVTLRNSKVPPHIMAGVKDMLNSIMDDMRDHQEVSLNQYMTHVANMERDIMDSIKKGSPDYLTRSRIMPKATYTNPASSPYFYYELWEAVFADKYGHITELPSQMVKVSLDCNNATGFLRWVGSMEDQIIAEKLKQFCFSRNRRTMKMILVPMDIVEVHGIPTEIIAGSKTREIIFSTMEAYYLLLESAGMYCVNDNRTRLMSDTH